MYVDQNYNGVSSMTCGVSNFSCSRNKSILLSILTPFLCLNQSADQVVTIPEVSNEKSVIKEDSPAFRPIVKWTDLLKGCIDRGPRQH